MKTMSLEVTSKIARGMLATLVLGSAVLTSCTKKDTSFSMIATGQTFQQNQAKVNNKIDILWVVDNSGSMDPLQQNLVVNFSDFIGKFLFDL